MTPATFSRPLGAVPFAVLVAALVLSGASKVRAQAHNDQPQVEGAGAFTIGAAFLDLSALNDRLSVNGYEELSSTMMILGGQGQAVFESGFVLGARGGGFLTPTVDGPDAYRADFGGGFGMAEFGYAFFRTRAMLFLATAGIGGYGLSLTLSEQRALAFDDVLRDPRRSETLSVGGLLGGVTLGFDGRVPIGPVDDKGMRPFFTLGVRTGFLYGPPLGEWSLGNGSDATDAPSAGLSAGYVLLAVGFGGAPEAVAR